MSRFKGFKLNGTYYSREWLLEKGDNLSAYQFTKNQQKALRFCARWLSGEQEFVVQTSGSTGKPKSIRLTRSQMTFSARMTGKALQLSEGNRAFVCLSPQHIGGIMMLVRGLVLNLELTIVEPASNPFESLSTGVENIGPFEIAAFVPLQLQTILNSDNDCVAVLDKMKAILLGGAPVSITLLQELQKVAAPIYQTFGMTETVSHIAMRKLNGTEVEEEFQVLPGVEIGQDFRGCLTIKSALTNHRQISTNDIVDIKTNNRFVWLGRVDNVINTGGVIVQAEKVEQVVEEALSQIEEGKFVDLAFFVGPVPDDKYGQVVTVVFEGLNISEVHRENILSLLSIKLNKYEIPKRFYVLKQFIRTSNGKINRQANLNKILES